MGYNVFSAVGHNPRKPRPSQNKECESGNSSQQVLEELSFAGRKGSHVLRCGGFYEKELDGGAWWIDFDNWSGRGDRDF